MRWPPATPPFAWKNPAGQAKKEDGLFVEWKNADADLAAMTAANE
jgi:hypothetical protein